MKKFIAVAFCACLFSAPAGGRTNLSPRIHPSLTIKAAAVAPLTITSGTPPSGKVGLAYGGGHIIGGHPFTGFILSATGGTWPYTWSATGLPHGLTTKVLFWGGSTRCCVVVPVIAGTPTAAGTYRVVLTVTDSANPKLHKSAIYTVKILPR